MVISRNDLKRKRSKECAGLTHIPESPKRTKVHAQRKFAQGSNVNSPVITPVKELESKDLKLSKVDIAAATANEILPPAKRPHTEDFLTFLCFRTTPNLPPNLKFFNSVSLQQQQDVIKVAEPAPKVADPEPKPTFIAFGVRKRADPFINNKLEKKRRHALAIQALRRKYQEQRMAKIRSVTINQQQTQQKTTTRSSTVSTNKNVVPMVPKQTTTKVKVKVVSTKIHTTKLKQQISRTSLKEKRKIPVQGAIVSSKKTVSIVNNKQKMCLRSRSGRFIHRELISVKKRKIIKKTTSQGTITRSGKQLFENKKKVEKEPTKIQRRKLPVRGSDRNKEVAPVKTEKKKKIVIKKIIKQKAAVPEKRLRRREIIPDKNVKKKYKEPEKQERKKEASNEKVDKKKETAAVKNDNNKEVTTDKNEKRKEKIIDKMDKKKGHVLKKVEMKKGVLLGKNEKKKESPSEINEKKKEIMKNEKKKEVMPLKNGKKKGFSPEKIENKKELLPTKIENKKESVAEKKRDSVTGRNEKKKESISEKIDKKLEANVTKHEETPNKETPKKKELEKSEKKNRKEPEESESEFDSDDDEPLVKTVKKNKTTSRSNTKVLKKSSPPMKRPAETGLKAPPAKKISPTKESPVKEPETTPETRIARPSRKTKEAAAIYMEILGHKLVNETEIDEDNISIDSFPELPNVRKTEQREKELKNLNKTKQGDGPEEKVEKAVTRSTKLQKVSEKAVKKSMKIPLYTQKRKILRSTRVFPNATTVKKKNLAKIKKSQTKVGEKKEKEKLDQSFSDSDEEPLSKLTTKRRHLLRKSKIVFNVAGTKTIPMVKKRIPFVLVNKSKLNALNEANKKRNLLALKETIPMKKKETVTSNVLESEKIITKTNEEIQLVELTTNITTKIEVVEKEEIVKSHNESRSFDVKKVGNDAEEVKKQPILSSDDEEKVFRGFFKSENEVRVIGADLLCKDVGKRFGKGKVNMSNEQIEKWLKESALAGNNMEKEEKDEIMETETEKPEEKKDKMELPVEETTKTEVTPIVEVKHNDIPKPQEKKTIFVSSSQQRRSLLNKKLPETPKNANAFSVQNESSVYAFEADIDETPLNTPFRRLSRRPSSTNTSKSEDEQGIRTTSEMIRPEIDANHISSPDDKKSVLKTHKFNNLPPLFAKTSPTSGPKKSEEQLQIVEIIQSKEESKIESNVSSFNIPSQPMVKPATIPTNTQMCPPKPVSKSPKMILKEMSNPFMFKKSDTANASIPFASSAKTNSKSPKFVSRESSPQCNQTERDSISSPSLKTLTKSPRAVLRESSPLFTKKPENNIPSSPSTSSMSSASASGPRNVNKPAIKSTTFKRNLTMSVPSKPCKDFPEGTATMMEAPTFHPTEKEFQDPVEYISKIRAVAERFGICRIVPPANFKPECKVSDDMRFTAYNQYVHKMLHRWGPNFKELMAIKKYLATQSITLTQPPWIGGMEIDLPRLYQTVQNLGGLKEVIEKKKWSKVAEGMKIPKSAQDRVTKLDDIYCKYLLPYDTLSPAERDKLFDEVETEWAKRESRSLLQSQRQHPALSPNAEAEPEAEDEDEADEECITKGRNMALNAFYRIARNTMSMWFKNAEPQAADVEAEFWRHVQQRQNHVCVHSGSIDCGGWGYGFACSKNSPFARHAWNLKVLTNNSGNILRSMGPLMGVTVPTLHVGMVFSAVCWYRDPHALPWIEYLHTGASKIWYGVPDSFSQQFHSTLLKLVPSYCLNKKLWLSSDTAMIPPGLLIQNGVSLCRTVQEPGQFIVVFPKAFTSSLCTGYLVSESVYFAPADWMNTAEAVFKDIRESCESSMFSLERLMVSIINDQRTNVNVLQSFVPRIAALVEKEKTARKKLEELGLKSFEKLPMPEAGSGKRKKKAAAPSADGGEFECEVCRANLFLSLVTNTEEEIDYCLDHAYDYIMKDMNFIKNFKLMITYDEKDLDELIVKLNASIQNKLIKKMPGKYTGMPTLLK